MSRPPNRHVPGTRYPVHSVKGFLSPNHPAAVPYQRTRGTKRPKIAFAVGLTILASAPFTALPFVIPALARTSWPWLVLITGWMLVCAAAAEWLDKRNIRCLEAETREDDRKAIGPLPIHGNYVGVAYADGFWSLNTSYSWDRGWLSIAPHGLVFEGRGSSFALPVHAVRAVRLAKSPDDVNGSLRIFIDWIASDEETNTLSLEGRVIARQKERLKATEELFQEIQTAFAKHADQPLSPRWPPAVNVNRLLQDSIRFGSADWGWVVKRSLAASLGFAVPLLGILRWATEISPDECVHHALFAFVMLASMLPIYFWFRRYNRRLQTPPPAPAPLVDRQEVG